MGLNPSAAAVLTHGTDDPRASQGPSVPLWRFQAARTGAEMFEAVEDAERWGFPRDITITEIASSEFYWLRPGVVFWLERHWKLPEARWLHLAVDPVYRKRWPVRDWLSGVRCLAELDGAEELRFAPLGQSEAPWEYLRRLGWQRDGMHLVKRLGGTPWEPAR